MTTAKAAKEQYANSGRLIFPTHFPSPTGGNIERDGKAYRFAFCGEGEA